MSSYIKTVRNLDTYIYIESNMFIFINIGFVVR